jgi:hypothetical protein
MAACVLSPPLVVESDDCGAAEGLSLGVCESGWLGWVWLEGEAGAGEVCAISSPDPVSEIKPSNSENRCTFIAGSNWTSQLEGCDFGVVWTIRLHPQRWSVSTDVAVRERDQTRVVHGRQRSCLPQGAESRGCALIGRQLGLARVHSLQAA